MIYIFILFLYTSVLKLM
ncbi:hypothetical protein MXB_5052 [Myxobolus squamalis]|nr:hypothetical protein MXB_5052 [Myxobolus squamalis]